MNRQDNEKWEQNNTSSNNDPYFKDDVSNNDQKQNIKDDPFAASDIYGQRYQNYQGYQADPNDPYAQFMNQKPPKRSKTFEPAQGENPYMQDPYNRPNSFGIIVKALLFVLLFFAVQVAVVLAVELPIMVELMASGITDDNELNRLMLERVAPYNNYLSALSGFVTIVIVLLIFVFKRQNPFKELSFNKTKLSTIALCLLVGFTLNFSCNVLFMFMPESWLADYSQASESLDNGSIFSYILGGVIMAPIVEEIVFRGLVMKRFQKCMPSVFAAILAAVVFGVCHGNLVWAIYAGSLGIILGMIFARFESIIPCICVHLAFNSVSAIMQAVYEIPAIKNMTEAQELIFNGVYTIFSFAMVAVSVALITIIMTSQNLLVKNNRKEDHVYNE